MVGVPVEWVAIGSNTSSMVGLVAASLPDGARVLSAEPEFTSLLWPFLAQDGGIEVELVAVDALARRRRAAGWRSTPRASTRWRAAPTSGSARRAAPRS
ncbi:MAG TPA: hypothetical protein VFM57_10195 [Thermoleophilaceae bacterium]|nr:hypothetical protein [Thermoleophilaceae bacterium]